MRCAKRRQVQSIKEEASNGGSALAVYTESSLLQRQFPSWNQQQQQKKKDLKKEQAWSTRRASGDDKQQKRKEGILLFPHCERERERGAWSKDSFQTCVISKLDSVTYSYTKFQKAFNLPRKVIPLPAQIWPLSHPSPSSPPPLSLSLSYPHAVRVQSPPLPLAKFICTVATY